MTDFAGVDRRHHSDLREIIDSVRELKRNQREVVHDIKCLKEGIEKYQPFLDKLMSEDGNWRKLKNAVIERSATGIVWALILLIGLSIWEFIVKRVIH